MQIRKPNKHFNGRVIAENPSRTSEMDDDQECPRSWIYTLCLKCHQKEIHPSWQPKFWPKLCPFPFGLTYRQFSRMVALTLIVLLTYVILYAIIGEAIAPGGYLFQLVFLYVFAYFGGWLVSLTSLPALVGMLFTGLLFQNTGLVNINDSFSHITRNLRHVALVMILIRAGLDLDPGALKRVKFTVLKLCIGPWLVEAAAIAVFTHFLMDFPWNYGFLLGSIVAAVAPAVVVPCLFRLRSKGYGVAKGIPTLIIAVASIDDAASVAVFGIIKSIMFSDDSLAFQILQGPICLIGGIGFGVMWGVICNFVPEKNDPFVIPLRVFLLLVGGLVSMFGSEMIGFSGAGPLACVAAAFTSLCFWCRHGWEIEHNPAGTSFEIFWMIIEPALFSVTGAEIKFYELDKNIVAIAVGILVAGMVIRIIGTVVLGVGSKLNFKEKLFVSFSWISKATVQAALGPVALTMISKENSKEYEYAEHILMMAVLSIILTAPAGAFLISITGTHLLTATKFPEIPAIRRSSHRRSIRDISIIDEEEVRNANIDTSVTHKK